MRIGEIDNTLKIERQNLPQIDFDRFEEILASLKSNNMYYLTGTVPASDLKPIQDKLNMEKVHKMIEDNVPEQDRTLFISKEGFIVDGHHYWAACNEVDPEKRINVILILTNIVDVLNWFNTSDYVEHKKITESKE